MICNCGHIASNKYVSDRQNLQSLDIKSVHTVGISMGGWGEGGSYLVCKSLWKYDPVPIPQQFSPFIQYWYCNSIVHVPPYLPRGCNSRFRRLDFIHELTLYGPRSYIEIFLKFGF
jgi:hypothetical protein